VIENVSALRKIY